MEEGLEYEAETLIEDVFPEGCTWECYLHNNNWLNNHFNTEEEAIKHWLNHGRDQGKDCSCTDEGKSILAEKFPEGCTWECYLDNHSWLRNHLNLNTEEEATKHWLEHGRDKGKDCSCKSVDEHAPAADGGIHYLGGEFLE